MASEVDICNLALANLGDTATVASIDPPEGSAQAQHCARFYPIARNALLEMATWGFATKRVALAAVTNPSTQWQFAYGMPSGVVNLISVLPQDSTDDYSQIFTQFDEPLSPQSSTKNDMLDALYTPQPYAIELDDAGEQMILTNAENATLRYTTLVTDTTSFSPLFVVSLGWFLASMLAGALIKGDAGAAEAKRCLAMFQAFESQAEASDANQRMIAPRQVVPWIAGR